MSFYPTFCYYANVGRHYKQYSPEEKERFIKRIKNGAYLTQVAREIGVSRTIIYRWVHAYDAAGTLKALHDRRPHGSKHWKVLPATVEKKVLARVIKDPSLSLRQLASLVGISRTTVWNILRRHQLNTQATREVYSKQGSVKKINPVRLSTKFAMVQRFESGEKVKDLCKEFGVSRIIFYRWLKRYISNPTTEALENQRPKGKRHYHYNIHAEGLLKALAVSHPRYSLDQLWQELRNQTGKAILSRNGTYMTLKRLGLHTRALRQQSIPSKSN